MRTIFFVEDDPSLQDIAMLVFQEPDFKLTVFDSAEQVLAETRYPDVYVLDKQLPGIDGLELCRKLKSDSRTSGIPIVVLSAAPKIKLLAADAGAEAVLEKPFSVPELLQLVTNIGRVS